LGSRMHLIVTSREFASPPNSTTKSIYACQDSSTQREGTVSLIPELLSRTHQLRFSTEH
jgi:hypothetical protein